MPISNVKICEGLLKKVQIAKSSDELETYLKLKSITVTGNIFKKNIIVYVMKSLECSRITAYRKINSLTNKGFSYKNDKGDLILNSYDKIFKMFGFSKDDDNLIVFKVPSADPLAIAAQIEFSRNLKQQEFIVYKHHVLQKYGCTEKTSKSIIRKVRKIESKKYNNYNEMNSQVQRAVANNDVKNLTNSSINYDITISSQLASKLLGYKSKSSGWKKLKELQAKGLLKIEKRDDICTNLKIDKYSLSQLQFESKRYCYCNSKGYLFIRSSNKVTIE